jgi:hypothetical protein
VLILKSANTPELDVRSAMQPARSWLTNTAIAGILAGILSGIPSTTWAIVTGGDIWEATVEMSSMTNTTEV